MKWTLLGRESDEDGDTTTWAVEPDEDGETVTLAAAGAREGSAAEEWLREPPADQGGRTLMQVIADRKGRQ